MVTKLLIKNQKLFQLIIALVGTFLGVLILLVSFHYLLKVNEYGEGADVLGAHTVMVQKKIGNSTTLQLGSTDFNSREIQSIRKNSFVREVAPVLSNNFGVVFETSDPMLPYFRSDVFIQSVKPSFLDVTSKQWKWNDGEQLVPIILPREFLVMLNTFMSASGIPQISDDLAKNVGFKIVLSNGDSKQIFQAKIIGFTNEVSAILVPENFMMYGITHFGKGESKKITQLMIQGKEKQFGLLETFLARNHLETKNGQLLTGRLKSIVSSMLVVIVGISFLILFFSSLVLIQYMQLLVSRNAYEIKTLLRLGYFPVQIYGVLVRYFLGLFLGIVILAVIMFLVFKNTIDNALHTIGLYVDDQFSLLIWLTLGLTILVFALIAFFTSKRSVYAQF